MSTARKGRDLETKTPSLSTRLARNISESMCLESVRNSCHPERERRQYNRKRGKRWEGAFQRFRAASHMVQRSPGPITNHSYTPCCLRVNSWAFLQVAQRRQCAPPPVRQVSQARTVERIGEVEWNPRVPVAQQFRCGACPFVNACTSAQETL